MNHWKSIQKSYKTTCTGGCPKRIVVDYCETVQEMWTRAELERDWGKEKGLDE